MARALPVSLEIAKVQSISGIVRLDAARISFEAWRQADSVAPPPRYDPFRAGVTGAAIAGGVVAFCWLVGSSHMIMTGEIVVIVILAFALPYVHLRSEDRKNEEAFEKEYIRLLELERVREERLPPATQSRSRQGKLA